MWIFPTCIRGGRERPQCGQQPPGQPVPDVASSFDARTTEGREQWLTSWDCSASIAKGNLMFLPQNMTKDEKTLAASIARQVLAKEPDATPERVEQLRHQAEEIAAEQIHAARGAAMGEGEPVPLEDDRPGSLFRQLSGTSLGFHIAEEWERMELERVYREAVEWGRSTTATRCPCTTRSARGRSTSGIRPRIWCG